MRKTKTLSITSGKGGVGKTTLVANLAYQLSQMNKKVLIFDGDVGMANVDIMFGQKAPFNIIDVLNERKVINEVLYPLTSNIDLLSGGSGNADFYKMSSIQKKSLLDIVEDLQYQYDFLIVDTAPGLTEHVFYLNAAVDEIILVLTPEPASFTDAYALLKVMNQLYHTKHFSILCNQTRDLQEGVSLFHRFADVVDQFLTVGLSLVGVVPHDPLIRKLNIQQRLVLRQQPDSAVAEALRAVSANLLDDSAKGSNTQGLKLFWSQLVGLA
jgi:flagellar biosynthesis protein FlhG